MWPSSYQPGWQFPGAPIPLSPPLGQQAFQRVWVDYMVLGQARVSWTFDRHFRDPAPDTWRYTLEVGQHGTLPTRTAHDAIREDDWEPVSGSSDVLDAAVLVDYTRRALGKSLLVAYRVKLVTGQGTYWSPPATSLGALGKQDWLRAREIVRKETLLHRKATSVDGYLLRRKRRGAPCTKCLDPGTGDVTLSRCDVCEGTRFVDGYFKAVPYAYVRVDPTSARERQDTQAAGSQKTETTRGRLVAFPGLESMDVWVDAHSDRRHRVHVRGVVAQLRSVPLVLDVELRQAPFDDPVYRLPLDGG